MIVVNNFMQHHSHPSIHAPTHHHNLCTFSACLFYSKQAKGRVLEEIYIGSCSSIYVYYLKLGLRITRK